MTTGTRDELVALLLKHGHAEWDRFAAEVVADVVITDWANGGAPEVVREFLDGQGQGYVIERHLDHYRYIWREAGEDDDEGEWYFTESGAISAAWQDWKSNGTSPHFFPWGKSLEAAATTDGA